ncbi:flagellar assembly protein FliX [Sphingomonas parva]|uniref:flagellar assembly protein FliX n=1 Tax=Sphingomonas parva TaxID=2555898 RepID=UPI001432036C|nr:flagellar assembly protein FliX [Sphingomonas parva]
MRITGLPPIRPKDLRPAKATRARFSVPSDEGSRATGALQPLTSVDMLLAIAAVDEEAERRRQMAAAATAGLDALEALDQAADPEDRQEKAQAVAEWAGKAEPPSDPDLARLQTQIELRALIEIAKFERDR